MRFPFWRKDRKVARRNLLRIYPHIYLGTTSVTSQVCIVRVDPIQKNGFEGCEYYLFHPRIKRGKIRWDWNSEYRAGLDWPGIYVDDYRVKDPSRRWKFPLVHLSYQDYDPEIGDAFYPDPWRYDYVFELSPIRRSYPDSMKSHPVRTKEYP